MFVFERNTKFCFGHFELKISIRNSSGDVQNIPEERWAWRRELAPRQHEVLKSMAVCRLS